MILYYNTYIDTNINMHTHTYTYINRHIYSHNTTSSNKLAIGVGSIPLCCLNIIKEIRWITIFLNLIYSIDYKVVVRVLNNEKTLLHVYIFSVVYYGIQMKTNVWYKFRSVILLRKLRSL